MLVEGKPRKVFFPPDTLFTAFIAMVEKIITYALGEHDPGSAQNWRTSNDFCSPVMVLMAKMEYGQTSGNPTTITTLFACTSPKHLNIYTHIIRTYNP